MNECGTTALISGTVKHAIRLKRRYAMLRRLVKLLLLRKGIRFLRRRL
ncbi:hypothetical protein [Lutibaculum baratangense]|uniref:Uncharacterized protein n=1 Tax=Lutibaculum baratangense AMV1 TaxID=631454 RepID=V4TJJ6_9HYPH|nr:hypothetical protein [Lutibaculum baratangense]ESR26078.1 hypothetical protein N177_1413 [Lutibaculum baratangense AMV1]